MSLSLQDTTAVGATKATTKRQSRRRNRTTNLEKEVEKNMSQEENDENVNEKQAIPVPTTPTTLNKNSLLNGEADAAQSPSVGQNAAALAHTPRRSTRKSIKPVQEYEDIVSRKRRLRSGGRVDNEEHDEAEEEPQKWTPAKVGRVSQKRARKSRRAVGVDKSKKAMPSSSENEDNEIGNDKESEEKTAELNEPNAPIDSEVPVMTEAKVDNQNCEETLDETNQTKADHTNVDKEEEEIIEKFEDEIESELETDLNEQHVDNNNALKKDDDIGRAEEVRDELPKDGIHSQNAENAVLNTTPEICNEKNIREVEKCTKDGFGNYLKNNLLDMSDLGLNPLSDDGAECAGDKTAEPAEQAARGTDIAIVTLNDDTFNDSDCVIVNTDEEIKSNVEVTANEENKANEEVNVNDKVNANEENKANDEVNANNEVEATENMKENEEDMLPLCVSDDETNTSPPRKSPRIVLTTHDGQQQLLNSSAPLLPQNATPKRYSKTAQRKPTPFRGRSTHLDRDDAEDAEAMIENNQSLTKDVTIIVSKMEPKEIVLRSIRKRSFSVCIGGVEAENRRKNVTFYSPANQTTILEDLDIRIVESVKKGSSVKQCPETFVTHRRKRSLSFDDAAIRKNLKSPGQASTKIRTTPITKPPRTKLPNFAAIHRKNFEKMENLVDHMNRKAERAKILTNSAAKLRDASAQKSAPPTNTALAVVEKPRAMKKINLHNSSVNTTFTEKSTKPFHTMANGVPRKDLNDSKLPIPQIAVLKPMPSTAETTVESNQQLKQLPNPRLGIIKPHTITSFASTNNKNPTPAKNACTKPIHTRQPLRPAFNLSTAVDSFNVNVNNAKASSSSTVGVSANTTMSKTTALITTATTHTSTARQPISFNEKMASRRQRRMDMFKGRGGGANAQRTTPGTAEKNYSHQIRGVRSNRRFELQMAHRKNMEH